MSQTFTTDGTNGRQRERDLIDAAIRVNAAPTVDDAFTVLAQTGTGLLGCRWLAVVVWDEDLSRGLVRACAGTGGPLVGEPVPPTHASAATLALAEPTWGPPDTVGLSRAVQAMLAEVATMVRVPLVTESCHATFHASWHEELDEDEIAEAVDRLLTLTRLTTLAERQVREREAARADTILDNVGDAVVVVGGDNTVKLNAAARELLALGDRDPGDLAHDLFDVGTLAGESPEAPRRFRSRISALDGRELVVDGSIAPLGPGSTCIVFRDVTEEHERAFVNEQYLHALFDSLPMAVSVLDPDTSAVLAVNRAHAELVGYAPDEMIGARPPYPWWADATARPIVRDGKVERAFRHRNGRLIPVEVSAHPIRGEGEQPLGILGIADDLSERRRLEQQLVRSGKLAAIGELAAGVAHEVNNPLFAILGLTEFLLKETEPGTKAHGRLELIQQTGLEIKEIVRALLDFARENAEERHVVPLEEVVRQTVDLVRRTNAHKGVELVDDYDDCGELVLASPNQLKQIFLNLFANARQAMPDGGTVRIDVRRDGDGVAATVTDDGPGIEADLIDRIFEPFFTTKRLTGGTGLGLSVSLGIAEAHGGTLTVRSSEGEGAEFALWLPIAREASE